MQCGHSRNGLVAAGLILSLVGIGVVLIRTLHIPGYWIPLAVGLALLVAGAVRRAKPGGS